MKKINKILIYSLLVAIVCTIGIIACSKEDQPDTGISVINTGRQTPTEFDVYLEKIFTKPYNISYLYRWEDIESDMNYTLIPATYQNSVKMSNLVKYLCLDAYEAVAPDDFLKKYFPKMIMLVGSYAYRNNGTIVLGTAEGGLKITLYGINDLETDFSNPDNIEFLYNYYFRTIFHEFSHILHQTIDYPNEFRTITSKDYIGDSWSNNDSTLEQALQKGYISRYSRKDPNEDFVELIAHYITYSDEKWNDALTAAGANGASIINQKIEMVKNYMQNSWNIGLDALKAEVQGRANNLQNVDLDNIN